jgi:site-specific recombinase XerD
VKGYKKNTIAGSFRIIRLLLNLAIKKNFTKNYPFKDFKIVSEDVDKDYLPLEKVTQLHDLYDSGTITERLKGTLGYFLFSCYTGLRFSDASRLRANMIEGNHLIIKTQKTKKQVKIPLSKRAISLLDTELAGLFSRPLKQSNSRVNTDLGEIMAMTNITKHITYHCSRHSFAINSLILGIDISVISNVLGHTSIKTTQIYAKIVDTYKYAQMDKWNSI